MVDAMYGYQDCDNASVDLLKVNQAYQSVLLKQYDQKDSDGLQESCKDKEYYWSGTCETDESAEEDTSFSENPIIF